MNENQVKAAVLEYVKREELAKCEIASICRTSLTEWTVELVFDLADDVAIPERLLVTVDDSSGGVKAVQY
jgi:hypothetical protein